MDGFKLHLEMTKLIVNSYYNRFDMFTFHNDVYILKTLDDVLIQWSSVSQSASVVYTLSDISEHSDVSVAIAGHDQIVACSGQNLYRITPTKNILIKKLDLIIGCVNHMKFTSDKTLVIYLTKLDWYKKIPPIYTIHEVRGIFDPPSQVLREVSVGTGIDPGSLSVVAQYI
jgi:hypothetical protein